MRYICVHKERPTPMNSIFHSISNIKACLNDMNPGVEVEIVEGDLADDHRLLDDSFHVIYCADSIQDLLKIEEYIQGKNFTLSCLFDSQGNICLIHSLGNYSYLNTKIHDYASESIIFSSIRNLSQGNGPVTDLLNDMKALNEATDPSAAAIVGAVASQGSIKVLTKQNRPISGLFVFDVNNITGRIYNIILI